MSIESLDGPGWDGTFEVAKGLGEVVGWREVGAQIWSPS